MRANILDLLRRHAGQYLSGEQISQRLAVSRTAVWKHIQILKQDGYEIDSHPRLGYCFRQAPDLLLPEELTALLTTENFGRKIHYFDDVDSTNKHAKKLALDGCPHGTVVVSEAQNQGKGRMSRRWFSPKGKGIWLSLVLRPPFSPEQAPKCTLMTAVAICKAIQETTGITCGIKWPNDILYGGKKLVGILTEISAEMDVINYVVIGMGINVNIEKQDFPEDIADIATSLRMIDNKSIDRVLLAANILKELEFFYNVAIHTGFASILKEWRKMSITLGQMVDVIGFNTRYSGMAKDIDDDGALLVQTSNGLERVIAGDVSIRPTL